MTQLLSSLQVAMDPLEHFKDEWIVKRKTLGTGEITIDHVIEEPDDFITPGYNKHVLCFQFNSGARQVTRIENDEYDGSTKPGNIWLLSAHTAASWHWETKDEALIFSIDPAALRRVALENNHPKADYLEVRSVLYGHDPILARLAAHFLQEMQSEGFGGRLYLESLANLFLLHLLRRYCTIEDTLKPCEGRLPKYKLNRVLDYIHAHLSNPISLDQIAQQANLSKCYFSQMFKQSMGISPHQYVLQQRVAKAKELLKQTQMPIANIALECGFANQTHLSRHFRLQTGVSPKVYRKEL